MKTIVISAVNIVEAGPLTILRDCLSALSQWVADREGEFRVIAIVYKKELADYPHIEYIETQWPKKKWINRLWYEYVSLKRISKSIGPVYLWFSLHDTTPNVVAERQAVYCHNALFSYRWKFHDLFFAPKMTVIAVLTKFIYRRNVHRNCYVVVQQVWLREAMNKMFAIDRSKIVVAPPTQPTVSTHTHGRACVRDEALSLLYAALPNLHKNSDVILSDVDILNYHHHNRYFNVYITVRGNENKYAGYLYIIWSKLTNLLFKGYLTMMQLRG